MTEYLILALLALFAIREVFIVRERDKLLNRIMAKSYSEYRYYEDKWKGDLKEIDKVREDTREEFKQAAEEPENPANDLSKFEEDWADENHS